MAVRVQTGGKYFATYSERHVGGDGPIYTVTVQGKLRPLSVDEARGRWFAFLARFLMLLGAVMAGWWVYHWATGQDARHVPLIFQPFTWLARVTGIEAFNLIVTFGLPVGLVLLFGAANLTIPIMGLIARAWPGKGRQRVRVTLDPAKNTLQWSVGVSSGMSLPLPTGFAFGETMELREKRDDAPKRWTQHSGWNYFWRHLKRANAVQAVARHHSDTMFETGDLERGRRLRDALEHALLNFQSIIAAHEKADPYKPPRRPGGPENPKRPPSSPDGDGEDVVF